jgi:MauM/NapG family ferredoxin protein
LVQTGCLLLFLLLFLAARDQGTAKVSGPLKLFFDLDPLVLVATWLATGNLVGLSLLALVTVAVTLCLGRVFCGWVCPFGTLHNVVASGRGKLRRILPRTEQFSRWQRAKYYLLVALLIMALLGAHWVGVLDPQSLLYRSFATAFWPGTQFAVEEGATQVYLTDPHLGPLHLTWLTEPVYRFSQDHLFGLLRPAFTGSTFILLVFLLSLVLNLYRARFWCRYLCPLGALLGLCSHRPLLRLTSDENSCDACSLCSLRCPAAAQPEQPGQWLPTECFGCWNCVKSCKNAGLDFKWARPWQKSPVGTVDLRKRATLAAVIGGVSGFFLMRVAPQAQGKTFAPTLIRPPGAWPERAFLQRCIQCGMCMKVCPTNALQPTWHEAGLEGVWTPLLVPRLGWCEYECNLCGQVCPTGAIQNLPLAEKKLVKIGLATIDTTRCLPFAYDRDCIVCEEHCPIPTKAIFFVQAEITLRDGSTRLVKQPKVDPDLCTGCGICETKCPFADLPAIRVTSAGETRHPANQPVLPGPAPGSGGDPSEAEAEGSDPYQ